MFQSLKNLLFAVNCSSLILRQSCVGPRLLYGPIARPKFKGRDASFNDDFRVKKRQNRKKKRGFILLVDTATTNKPIIRQDNSKDRTVAICHWILRRNYEVAKTQ